MWEKKKTVSGPPSANGHVAPPGLRLKFPASPIGPSDGSSLPGGGQGPLLRPVTEFDYELWNLGWVDGRLGQPIQENEAVLKAYADIHRAAELDSTKQRIAQLRLEIEKDGQLFEQAAHALVKAQKRAESVDEDRAAGLQEYSLALGVIYLLVGLLLFLSDIPLSLRLVAEGYDIPVEAQLDDGTMLVVEDIFVRPVAVVQRLWEPLVLALGFALAGVFIKIFIDSVIWKPKGDESSGRLRIFLSVTAFLFLFTLVAVGVFRSERQAEKAESSSGFDLSFTAEAGGSLGAPATEAAPKRWDWGFWSFLSITLMLPIIGGICFLSGWSRVQNWSFFRECHRSYRKQFRTCADLGEQRAIKKGELSALEESLARLERDSGDQIKLWKHLYRHGYWRGHAVPESIQDQDDLYARLDKMLVKEIATEARTRFWRGKEIAS